MHSLFDARSRYSWAGPLFSGGPFHPHRTESMSRFLQSNSVASHRRATLKRVAAAAGVVLGAASLAPAASVAATVSCPDGTTASTTSGPRVARVGVNDARQWWMGSPNLPAGYPVQAHRDLVTRDLTALSSRALRLRADFILSDMDTNTDGVVDSWTFPDALMRTLAQRQVRVLPLLRSAVLPDTFAKRQAFAKVTAAIVNRYRVGGAFWVANPSLSPVPIQTAEIWNEPNLTSYWAGTQADYGRLVGQVGYETQRLVPGFKFITGGMAERSSNGQSPSAWIQGALDRQGDEIPSSAGYFSAIQAIGLHAYGYPDWTTASAKANTQALANWRNSRTSADRVGIEITEMGWRWSASPSAASNTYSNLEIYSRYTDYFQWYTANMNGACGGIYAYNLRMANSGNTLDDGFGFYQTIGTLSGGDTTQRDAGVAALSAIAVLGDYAANAPLTD